MRILLLITAAVAWFTACSGDDPPEFTEAAPEAAEAALLTEQDLPPAWREESAGALDDVDLAERCDVLTPDGAFPSAVATASSPAFGTKDQRSAQSFAAVYESEEDASGAVSDLDARVQDCRDDFLAEVKRLAETEIEATGLNLGAFADIDVSIEQEALDSTGDQANIYHVEVTVSVFGTDRQFNADITLVRNGQLVSVLVYSAYGPVKTPEGEALLALLLGRLSAATEKLS